MKTMTIAEIKALGSVELRKLAASLKIGNYSRFTKEQLAMKVSEALKTSVSERPLFIKAIDKFVDHLISRNDNVTYSKVMTMLGGEYDSDLDELLETATIEQLKEVLEYKKTLNIEFVESKEEESETETPIVVEKKKVKKESIKKEKKEKSERVSKDSPREGSKSEEIMKYLQENPEESLYKVAKHFNTYYSVVKRISTVYLKK